MPQKLLKILLIACLLPLPQVHAAQEVLSLPTPGTMVHLSPALNPPILKGIKLNQNDPFKFDFVLDVGSGLRPDQNTPENQEPKKLIKYFLAALTTPEKDMWVNLSPYEKNRIVPDSFGQTEMGRDLLAQDYILKQITASLIYPEDELGRKFWKKIYEESAKAFGNTNVPVNTFNKVWIVPSKAVVYENAKAGTAYVVESSLKVMLEEDYLATNKNTTMEIRFPPKTDQPRADIASQTTNRTTQDVIRSIILPELTKEINEGANFAQLRQVYNSLILATWYKKKIKDSILSKVYADQNKVKGTEYADNMDAKVIYDRYLEAFKKGTYNYIKEEQDPLTHQMMPKKYFAGGMNMDMSLMQVSSDHALMKNVNDNAMVVNVNLQSSGVKSLNQQPAKYPGARALSRLISDTRNFSRNKHVALKRLLGPIGVLSPTSTGIFIGRYRAYLPALSSAQGGGWESSITETKINAFGFLEFKVSSTKPGSPTLEKWFEVGRSKYEKDGVELLKMIPVNELPYIILKDLITREKKRFDTQRALELFNNMSGYSLGKTDVNGRITLQVGKTLIVWKISGAIGNDWDARIMGAKPDIDGRTVNLTVLLKSNTGVYRIRTFQIGDHFIKDSDKYFTITNKVLSTFEDVVNGIASYVNEYQSFESNDKGIIRILLSDNNDHSSNYEMNFVGLEPNQTYGMNIALNNRDRYGVTFKDAAGNEFTYSVAKTGPIKGLFIKPQGKHLGQKELRGVLTSSRNDVIKRLEQANTDWPGTVSIAKLMLGVPREEVGSLVGLPLRKTTPDGGSYFTLLGKEVRIPVSIWNSSENWEPIIVEESQRDGVLQFKVESTKPGESGKKVRSFQIGKVTQQFDWRGSKFPVYSVVPVDQIVVASIKKVTLKDGDLDIRAVVRELTKIAGQDLDKIDTFGRYRIDLGNEEYYAWQIFRTHEKGWKAKFLNAKANKSNDGVLLNMLVTDPEGNTHTRVFEFGRSFSVSKSGLGYYRVKLIEQTEHARDVLKNFIIKEENKELDIQELLRTLRSVIGKSMGKTNILGQLRISLGSQEYNWSILGANEKGWDAKLLGVRENEDGKSISFSILLNEQDGIYVVRSFEFGREVEVKNGVIHYLIVPKRFSNAEEAVAESSTYIRNNKVTLMPDFFGNRTIVFSDGIMKSGKYVVTYLNGEFNAKYGNKLNGRELNSTVNVLFEDGRTEEHDDEGDESDKAMKNIDPDLLKKLTDFWSGTLDSVDITEYLGTGVERGVFNQGFRFELDGFKPGMISFGMGGGEPSDRIIMRRYPKKNDRVVFERKRGEQVISSYAWIKTDKPYGDTAFFIWEKIALTPAQTIAMRRAKSHWNSPGVTALLSIMDANKKLAVNIAKTGSIVGKKFPLTNDSGESAFTLFTDHPSGLGVLGFHGDAGWEPIVTAERMNVAGFYEFTVQSTREGYAPVERSFEVGRFIEIYKEKDQTYKFYSVIPVDRLPLSVIRDAVIVKRSFNTQQIVNSFNELKDYLIQTTNTNGKISFSVGQGVMFVWNILGLVEKGWRVTMLGAKPSMDGEQVSMSVVLNKEPGQYRFRSFEFGKEVLKEKGIRYFNINVQEFENLTESLDEYGTYFTEPLSVETDNNGSLHILLSDNKFMSLRYKLDFEDLAPNSKYQFALNKDPQGIYVASVTDELMNRQRFYLSQTKDSKVVMRKINGIDHILRSVNGKDGKDHAQLAMPEFLKRLNFNVRSANNVDDDATRVIKERIAIEKQAAKFFKFYHTENWYLSDSEYWKKLVKDESGMEYLSTVFNNFDVSSEVAKRKVRTFARELDKLWKHKPSAKEESLEEKYGTIYTFMTLAVMRMADSNLSRLRASHEWLYEFLSVADIKTQAQSLWLIVVGDILHLRYSGMHPEVDSSNQIRPALNDIDLVFGREQYIGALKRYVDVLKKLKDRGYFNQEIPIRVDIGTDKNKKGMSQVSLRDLLLWGLELSRDASVHNPRYDFSGDKNRVGGIQERLKLDQMKHTYGGADNYMIYSMRESFWRIGLDKDVEMQNLFIEASSIDWKEKGLVPPEELKNEFASFDILYVREQFSGTKFKNRLYSFLMRGFNLNEPLPMTADDPNKPFKGTDTLKPLNQKAWSEAFPELAPNFYATQRQGGIDLRAEQMNLETKQQDNQAITFKMDPAQLAQFQNALGFEPVIISILPLADLRAFMGIK